MRLSGRELECVRGGRDIFSALDFDIQAGQALAVTGENGSGKSSLLRMITGLLPAAKGLIQFEGGEDELTLAEQTHYLGHRDALKPSLTVLENLQFWQDFLGGEKSDAGEAIEMLGLGHAKNLPAGFLSTGQRRRMSLARLIAVKRPVWLLDEPTSALDSSGLRVVSALLTTHLQDGGLIVAATHGPLGISAKELRIGGPA